MKTKHLGIILTVAVMSVTLLLAGCGKKPGGGGDGPYPDTVDISEIKGVTVPVFGATPNPGITPTDQYTGTVSWDPALPEGTFEAEKEYTATITLTVKDGYTFDGISSDFFRVAGAETTSNAPNFGVVTAVFEATGNERMTTVNIKNIEGITVPDVGVEPVGEITPTDQFTGTVEWAPAVTGTFEPGEVYTATITLAAKEGYTFSGVLADFFEVAGADTVTYEADSNIVAAVFPRVGGEPPANFAFTPVAASYLRAPLAAGTPIGSLTVEGTQPIIFSLVTGTGTQHSDNDRFQIDGSSVKVKDTDLTAGTYNFRVRAHNGAGELFLNESITVTEPSPDDIKTDIIFESNHNEGTFTIGKSGGRHFIIDHDTLGIKIDEIHADLDFELIMPDGYIDVSYTGTAPEMRLRSTWVKTSGQRDVMLLGEEHSAGVRRFNSNAILDAVYNNYGYDTLGTRDPSAMAVIELVGAGTITKITVTYDSGHHSLRTFNTIEEMGAAAATYGDITKIKRALTKVENGQPITVVFLGGSITQAGKGSSGYSLYTDVSQIPDPSGEGYAGKTARWFYSTYNQTTITYVNQGFGGVGSGGGLEWLDDFWDAPGGGGLLKGADGTAETRIHEPDLVFIEFAVNDSMSGWWSGNTANMDLMIERILAESNAGVIVLCSLDFWNGHSADVAHSLAAAKHNVSVVNHRAALWPNIRAGVDIPVYGDPDRGGTGGLSYDAVHPLEAGHSAYADFIKYFLEQVRAHQPSYVFPTGLTLAPSSPDPIPAGETRQLTANITPNNATNSTVIWSIKLPIKLRNTPYK